MGSGGLFVLGGAHKCKVLHLCRFGGLGSKSGVIDGTVGTYLRYGAL